MGDHELWDCVHGQGRCGSLCGARRSVAIRETGSWSKVFWAMIICDLLAAFMALLWLKPLAAKVVRQSETAAAVEATGAPVKARGIA